MQTRQHRILPISIQRVAQLSVSFIIALICTSASAQLIGTVAGNGSASSSGNGSLATCSGVPSPTSICTDVNGNMFIVSLNSIRKVNSANGAITTIAGFDSPGFSGDGGPAIAAFLNEPRSICRDITGNLYIAEKSGHRIRKIDALTGIISTIAGTGVAGFSGDGGQAITATLNTPIDMKADNNGNLYVADYENFRIRKISLSSGIISTIAGNGSAFHSGDGGSAISAGLALPTSVCADGNGNIYLSEARPLHSSRIRKINATTGMISTVAGSNVYTSAGDGGLAINASMMSPCGLAADASGNIYFSDYESGRIRKINVGTGIIATLAGNGTSGYSGDGNAALGASLNGPFGIWVDNSGNVFFADHLNNRVRKIYVNLTSPPSSTPLITISASSTSTCSGVPIIITAIVSNGTPNMIYQWYRNGINVGTNSNIYAPSSLNHGDVISCILTSASCNGVVAINSNNITITGSVMPSITIAASASTVCPGTTVQFTATATNSGPNPTYQWKVNSLNAGANSASYTRVLNNNGDNITCELTADPIFTCASTQTVYSNQIAITVTVGVTGTISISPSANDICPGTPITFTSVVQNAGPSPAYQWQVNGMNVGSNQNFYTSDAFSNNDAVICFLTGTNSCNGVPWASPVVVMKVKSVPNVFVSPADTVVVPGAEVQLKAVITGSFASYIWNPSARLSNAVSLSPRTQPVDTTTQFTLTVITHEGCSTLIKSLVKVSRKFFMPNAFTPNDDGLNDVFRIPPDVAVKLISFSVYDRWGQRIFTTSELGKGWDGKIKGLKKEPGTYVYLINAMDGSEKILLKGSFVLIR